MLTRTSPLLTALLVLTTLGASPLRAAPPVDYEPVANAHQLEVAGSSNIHDWEAKTPQITGRLELPGQWREDEQGLQLVPRLELREAQPRLEVRIPVRSLKSGKNGLDNKMYGAMEADDHPHVTFTLKRATAKPATSNPASQVVTWQATGDLTVAGTTRSIELELKVQPMRDRRIKIELDKPLKMTDFNIDPPTAMLGMARAKDDVTVSATWILQRRTPERATNPTAGIPAAYRSQMTQVLVAYGHAQQALAGGNHNSALSHLTTLLERVEALAQLESDELPESLHEQWPATRDQLTNAAHNAAETDSLNAARETFTALSQTLAEALQQVGFQHNHPVTAYRHAAQRGDKSPIWIHVPLNDEEGKHFPVRSPYSSGNAQQPEPAALYLPEAVTDEE